MYKVSCDYAECSPESKITTVKHFCETYPDTDAAIAEGTYMAFYLPCSALIKSVKYLGIYKDGKNISKQIKEDHGVI